MLSRRYAWFVVIVATLTQTVSYIDRNTFSVLGPKITEALHLSETQYGWLASAFSMTYLFGTPIAGWWIDRIGARKGLVGSVLAWSSVAAMHALVPNFAAMFAMRLLLGLTEGPGFGGAAQTIQRVLPAKDRARGFGLLFTGSSIGGMLVPPMASRMYAAWGWRTAFLGTAAVGLIWVPLWIFATRTKAIREKMDIAPLAADRAKRPNFLTLVKMRPVYRGLCGVLALSFVTGFVQLWGAKYLARTFAIKQENVGHYLWLPPLVFDAGALIVGDLTARYPRRIQVWFVISTLVALCLALVPLAGSAWQGIGILSLAMAGAGALSPLMAATTLAELPTELASFGAGTLAGAQAFAYSIMGPLLGPLVGHYKGYSQVSVGIAAWIIPGSIAWLILWRSRAPEPTSTELPLRSSL
ncbi:MAG TPA: MFS transporter [Kofleriaceae bacterium]|jgi:ACS family hexuronate transporter-like MFS transporter